ncbi:MAG TPA: VOC family protein [Acidimicrobiales bacterium]|nr:VOC family protein [Acidimicrobiales bacterium]
MTTVRDFPAWRAHLEETYIAPPAERPESTGRGVHHLAMICSDVERTIRFYQDVIGFPLVEVMENRDYPGSTHFFLDIGHGNLLAFFDFPGLSLQEAVEAHGSVQHVAVSTDQDHLDAVRARLDGLEIPYLGPDRGLTDSVYVKDPDGIQIELLAQPLRFMEGHTIGG